MPIFNKDSPLTVAQGGTSATTAINAKYNLGIVGILSTTTNINGEVATTTNLYTVPTSRTAIITGAIFRITTATGLTGTMTAGIGIAIGEDDIFNSTEMIGFGSTDEMYVFNSLGVVNIASASDVIKLGIDASFGGTTVTLSIDLLGYLI